MLRGYNLIEVRATADGFDVRVPRTRIDSDSEDYNDLVEDMRRFIEIARGTVRLDLTALYWVSNSVMGRIIPLWRALRESGRVVPVVSHTAADFFRITRLNRVLEVWSLDPECILVRV